MTDPIVREPAGSPDGGRFATGAAGAEAGVDVLDPDYATTPLAHHLDELDRARDNHAHRIDALLDATERSSQAFNKRRTDAQTDYSNANIDRVESVLTEICADTHSATWEQLNDGAHNMVLSTVTCPHVRTETDVTGWAESHGYRNQPAMDGMLFGLNDRATDLEAETALHRHPKEPHAWQLTIQGERLD